MQMPPPDHLLSNFSTAIYEYGETVKLSALTTDTTYRFVKWSCPQIPSINNSTDPTVSFSQDCSNLKDVVVTAIFRQKGSLIVDVRDTIHTWVKVYKYGADTGVVYLGTAGSYTLQVGESLMVLGGTDTTTQLFDGWYSSKSGAGISNLSLQRLVVYNDGSIVYTGGITIGTNKPLTGSQLPKCCLCTEVSWVPNGTPPAVSASSAISVTPSLGCTENDPNQPGNPTCPVATVVNAAVTDGCYEIASVYVIDKSGNIVYYDQWAPGSGPSTWSSSTVIPTPLSLALEVPVTQCPTVYFEVRSVKYTLDFETELRLARIINDDDQIGKDKDVRISIYRINNSVRELVAQTNNIAGNPPGGNRTTWTSPVQSVEFYCGEVVEAVAEYNLRSKGFTFVQWDNNTLLYDTYPSPTHQEFFQFTMDDDRELKGIFKEEFRLRKVGVYITDATDAGAPSWYYPDQLLTFERDDINVWMDVEDNTHYGTKIHLLFNDPVDINTRYTIWANDLSQRIDYPNSPSDNIDAWTLDGYTWSDNATGASGYEAIFSLVEPTENSGLTPGIPRGEKFALNVSSLTKNTYSETLAFPYEDILMETEMPGIIIRFDGVTALANSGDLLDPDPELYTVYTGYTYDESGIDSKNEGYQPEDNFPDGVELDDFQFYEHIVHTNEKVDRQGGAGLALVSYDYDGTGGIDPERIEYTFGDFIWAFDTWLAAIVTSGVVSVALMLLGVPGAWPWILFYALIPVFAAIIAALKSFVANILENQDDYMGQATWIYSWGPGVWFGAHPQVSSRDSIVEDNKVSYDADFILDK